MNTLLRREIKLLWYKYYGVCGIVAEDTGGDCRELNCCAIKGRLSHYANVQRELRLYEKQIKLLYIQRCPCLTLNSR